jgi:hypothetical protein
LAEFELENQEALMQGRSASKTPKIYERLHDLSRQKQFKRLQLYQKYNPDGDIDFDKVNEIVGSFHVPSSQGYFSGEHKRSSSIAFGSTVERKLIPPTRDLSVEKELV